MEEKKPLKSPHAEREERILAFWNDKDIFNKSLAKASPKGEFVFYEGPPTANGRPGIHHLEARAFKDAIPRFRTMRGYHVRRKGGWDTHGLPVELAVEKELGLKSKKEIESYGVEKFNEKCKESVWTYVHEWEDFTKRMGYWVDLKNPYVTYKPEYMESVWNVIKSADKKGLLYKDYKVVPWCPRCGTALSSHELAQGYEDVKDLSVYAKFKVKEGQSIVYMPSDGKQAILDTTKNKVYFLVWTTTPWTLPGNVGLAVNAYENYIVVEVGEEKYILAEKLIKILSNVTYKKLGDIGEGNLLTSHKPVEYEPLYPFMKGNAAAFKVYAADFVTTEDGTGIVHIAPMYGQDDFELGTKAGLPKQHIVNEDGTFMREAGFLAGKFVKDEEVAVEIIKDLAHRGLLFHKEKHEHSYPFCWRCHTPLIYFARDSWYIAMSKLRHTLIKENEHTNWEPSYIKEGRFGEWLREVKDWAISRERYWGTPLPVWVCEKCEEKKVIGSVDDLKKFSKAKNTYYVMRHGEAHSNITNTWSDDPKAPNELTEKGKQQAREAATSFKGKKPDIIITSPFLRTKMTTDIVHKTPGFEKAEVKEDDRLREMDVGTYDGMTGDEFSKIFPLQARFRKAPEGVENYVDIRKRVANLLYELERTYSGKTILFVTHGAPAMLLEAVTHGFDHKKFLDFEGTSYIKNAEICKLDFSPLPHNSDYKLDLHKPYIDELKLACTCGGEMKRVKEVMDVWFDSGAMPFAQDHYPFENKKLIDGGLFKKGQGYPADFISEAIDQTRGWFYTLHAVGAIMGKGRAFKNVICLGHILDASGKKMSKHIGNVVNPWDMMNKYGADALRFWMYSINSPGDPKNFDEKTVDEIIKKVFNLASNVASFYKMYADKAIKPSPDSENVLDRWIIARLNQVIGNATDNLDKYVLLEPTRSIRDFIADLSQWYLRRSRDRFKEEGGDKQAALATTKHVLLTLAKGMAPFTPFFAEELYQDVGGEKESVHLEEWPVAGSIDVQLLKDMEAVRAIASKGLEARMTAKLNVRQPLQSLKVKSNALSAELSDLIKDEVNVKNVEFSAALAKDVELDMNITPELKVEGDLREFLRKIQDLRKDKGLSVGDKTSLIVPAEFKSLADKFGDEIKKATGLSSIESGDTLKLKD